MIISLVKKNTYWEGKIMRLILDDEIKGHVVYFPHLSLQT